MTESPRIEGLLRRIRREIRRRRAEYYGLRGAFWGAVAGVAVLLAKHGLGGKRRGSPRVSWSSAAWPAWCTAGRGVFGAATSPASPIGPSASTTVSRRRSSGPTARTARRSSTRWSSDTVARVESLRAQARGQARRAARRAPPGAARWSRAWSSWSRRPSRCRRGAFPTSCRRARRSARSGRARRCSRRRRASSPRTRSSGRRFEERDFAQRAGGSGATTTGDLSAIFKDTSLANARPDFNSFMKKGDERLRMLEQADRLPDLQSDFTQQPVQDGLPASRRRCAAASGRIKISPEKLRELLKRWSGSGRKGGGQLERRRDGRHGGARGRPERQGHGGHGEGARQDALDGRERSARRQGPARRARERARAASGGDRARGDGRAGGRGRFPARARGCCRGKGKSGNPKGDPTQRLRGNPFDVGVEGESRPGRKEGIDTNLVGRGRAACPRACSTWACSGSTAR